MKPLVLMFIALSFLKVDKDTHPIVHVSIQQRLKKNQAYFAKLVHLSDNVFNKRKNKLAILLKIENKSSTFYLATSGS